MLQFVSTSSHFRFRCESPGVLPLIELFTVFLETLHMEFQIWRIHWSCRLWPGPSNIPLACAPGQPNFKQSTDACWQHLAPIDSLVYMDGAVCFGCVRPFPATLSGHWQGRTKSNATPSFVFGLLLGWWIHCAGLLSWLAERCRAQTRLRQRSWLAVVPEHNPRAQPPH